MSHAQMKFYHELEEGMTFEREYQITREAYETFLNLSGDCSPLHVDDAYAKACGFDGVLMHGAILNAFVSNFVGMWFPGGRGLELSVDIRYLQPCYLGDTVRAQGKIAQKLDAHQVVVLHLAFINLRNDVTVANARVQVKMMSI